MTNNRQKPTNNRRIPTESPDSTASRTEDEQETSRRRGHVTVETIDGEVETIDGEIMTGTWPRTDVPAVDILCQSGAKRVQLPLDRVLRIVYDTTGDDDSQR